MIQESDVTTKHPPKRAYIKPRTASHNIPPKKTDIIMIGQKILEIPSGIAFIDVVVSMGYMILLSYE